MDTANFCLVLFLLVIGLVASFTGKPDIGTNLYCLAIVNILVRVLKEIRGTWL